jgi:hypothetical protein
MMTRLTHAGIAFALTVATYQAYVLVAVPFVEPASAAAPAVRALTDAELNAMGGGERYKPLLAAYFPADHWSLAPEARPIIIENGQAMAILDKYEQTASGALVIPRLAVIFFPRPRDRGGDPPRDAVILEPEHGAMLQMDQTLGAGAGGLGRMQYGQLLGAVNVRSDMREPGPADDLAIETRDLYMNENLIRTTEAVEMRLGAHRARGRGLEIRFSRTKASSAASSPTLFGKLDTLEITHEVAALIVPQQTTLFGQAAEPPAPASADAPPPNKLPAEITSVGPFRVDFPNRVATFTDNVLVRQRQADGKLDELIAPGDLKIYFAEVRQWSGDAATSAADDSAFGSVKLQPAMIEATGQETGEESANKKKLFVELKASSHDAAAVGDRLIIELIQRQVTLQGDDKMLLTYRGAQVHAPTIVYEMPAKDSAARLGAMDARGGGTLHATLNPARPGEVLEVRWSESMKLVRRDGQPVLILDGRPYIAMAGLGRLWADQLEILLRENQQADAEAPAAPAAGVLPAALEAERVVATGHVGIESAELNVAVNKLDLAITYPPPPAGLLQRAGASEPTPSGRSTAPRPLFQPNRTGGPPRSYNITGAVLQLEAVMRNHRAEMTAIHVDGGVDFKESTPLGAAAAADANNAPLRILAEHLQVTEADTPNAKIEIRGGDARGGMAEIAAGTTVLRAPALNINRGTSEAWINSPGEVTMLIAAAGGQQFAKPGPVAITWRDSMHLAGDRIELVGNVHVQHAEGWLRTRKLAIVLTAPVRFDGATGGGGASRSPQVAQLECWEGAVAEFDQHDETGRVTSHQHFELVSLVANQINGKLSGDGPGHVDSIHLSKHGNAMLAIPTAPGQQAPAAVADPSAPPQLRHLSIDFVRGVEGNLLTHTITAIGDVKTIYGPVATWDQRLTMTADGRPAPDTIWITCERLTAAENPAGRLQASISADGRRELGPLEMRADGDVQIEVEHPEKGAFTLRGESATYDQLKTMFMLKGSARAPATIANQAYPGAQPSEQSAEAWIYFQNTGEMKAISPQGVWMQFDPPPTPK